MKTEKEVTVNNVLYILRAKNFNDVDYVVEMEVFQCFGEIHSENGVEFDPPMRIFSRKGATSSLDDTDKLDDAQRMLDLYIKWDGCSDIDFYPDREGNEHYCGMKSAISLGLVIKECYEFARELLGNKVYVECFYE